MHRRELLGAGATVAAVGVAGCLDALDDVEALDETEASEVDREAVERAVHEEINGKRSKHDLDELSFDTDLREVARYHSERMAEEEFFAHDAPDGESMSDRYEKHDYDCRVPKDDGGYSLGAENIYLNRGFRGDSRELATRAADGWMDSPGHRKNILKPYWRREAIGVARSGSDVYVTQNFC